MSLVVRSQEELLAAVPHVLGFQPQESVVVLPFGAGLPITRVDLPTTEADREGVWDALSGPYSRHAQPGSRVAIICITADLHDGEAASEHLSARFQNIGIVTQVRVWSDGEAWRDLNSGQTGFSSSAIADQIAAATVFDGRAQPARSRDDLAASMVGDREPLAALLPAARAAAQASKPAVEQRWAVNRLAQFHHNGHRLSDTDGARMLVALTTISVRDAVWRDISRETSTAHAALWTDLTRRAPDEVRAAPAALLGFASWLHGDGAKAWCALDQVPAGQNYSMATIVAAALQNGVHPREWGRYQMQIRDLADELDQSYVPDPSQRVRPDRQPPSAPGRPGPSR